MAGLSSRSARSSAGSVQVEFRDQTFITAVLKVVRQQETLGGGQTSSFFRVNGWCRVVSCNVCAARLTLCVSLLSFHSVLLRTGTFAARWISTAFRTTKALLLLPFSLISSAGLPRPHPPPHIPPPPLLDLTTPSHLLDSENRLMHRV